MRLASGLQAMTPFCVLGSSMMCETAKQKIFMGENNHATLKWWLTPGCLDFGGLQTSAWKQPNSWYKWSGEGLCPCCSSSYPYWLVCLYSSVFFWPRVGRRSNKRKVSQETTTDLKASVPWCNLDRVLSQQQNAVFLKVEICSKFFTQCRQNQWWERKDGAMCPTICITTLTLFFLIS